MKRRVRPVAHARDKAMLDRVEMNGIDVALEIPVIADRVLPKTTLPKCEFTIGVARD